MNVKIKRLSNEVLTPGYAHEGDSGFDLVAASDIIIEPGETAKVPTGLAFEIPDGYEIQVRPRSGITSRTKLRVVLGTVDSGFRGEVNVIVDNIYDISNDRPTLGAYSIDNEWIGSMSRSSVNTYVIRKGDRIAQAVIAPVVQAKFIEVDDLGDSTRGTGGFGSTGVNNA